jgi:hypothetical protein
MSVRLIHNELIRVQNAVYWLRLYARPEGGEVAVVTEVPGNPGRNTMNGLDSIVSYLHDAFQADTTTLLLFQIWPGGYVENTTEISRVSLGRRPHWSRVKLAEIEGLVGVLPALPDHEQLLERVAALGGWTNDPIRRAVFRALPVNELPPPHAPFNCAHASRHEEILATLEAQDHDEEAANERRAGTIFLASLTPSDLELCSYHQANWRSIADQSVAILEALGTRDDRGDYQREARRRLRGKERGLLESLFRDPIVVGDGGYTNGQHRGCALRFSGAQRAAVVVDTEETGEFEYPWTYQGDG